jgi:subtilase family serine protease
MTRTPLATATVSLGLATLLAATLATPATAQRVATHTDPAGSVAEMARVGGTAPSWATPRARVGDAPTGQHRTVMITLALRDQRGAEDLARRVSTPGTAEHGKHLTSAQFRARFAPTRQTVDAVTDWLRTRGLRVGAVSGDHVLSATGTNAQLAKAFGVRIGLFTHHGKRLAAPDGDVRLPRHLGGAVTAVVGLDDTSQLTRPTANLTRVEGTLPARPATRAAAGSRRGAAAAQEQYCTRYWGESNNATVPQKYPAGMQSNVPCGYTVAQLRAIYGQSAANSGAGVRVAITGSYDLSSLVTDTTRWAREVGGTPLAAGQYAVVPPPGGYRDNPLCEASREAWHGEQAMDVQAVHAIAPRASITWYAGGDCTDNYAALGRAIADNTATVITSSWNAAGENVTPAVRSMMDALLVQAAIQGQSVLFSSGDLGDNSATGRGPQFPAGHPWVTAVGGTTVAINPDGTPKFTTGWEATGNTLTNGRWVRQNDADGPFAGGAGGGRSSVYAQPDYQRGVVPDTYARGKRTVPDVAALADAYTGMLTGLTRADGWAIGPGGGTSLASPIMAGLVANAQQHKGSSTRLGFLNAALYRMRANTAAMSDVRPVAAGIWTPGMVGYGGVTVPTTPGDYLVDLDARPQSLQSGPGWDPVTGVGTPAAGFVTAFPRG